MIAAALRCSLLLLAAQTTRAQAEVAPAELELLAAVDRAVTEGQRDALFACFHPQAHRAPLAAWQARWQTLRLDTRPLIRRTRVLAARGTPSARELLLEVQVTAAASPSAPAATMHEVAVCSRDGDAPPRLRLLLDCDLTTYRILQDAAGTWTCPFCNFRVTGPRGFIAAPRLAAASPCFDAITWHQPDADLCVDVGVQVLESAEDARAVTERLARAYPDLHQLAWSDWPRDDWAQTPQLSRAKLTARRGGDRALTLQVVCHGRLVYALACEGEQTAMAAQADTLARVAASFALLDATRPPAQTAVSSLAHHSLFGSFDGQRFVSPSCGVELEFPPGWTARRDSGGGQFRLLCTSADGHSAVRVVALAPPEGMSAWNGPLADAYLTQATRAWGKDVKTTTWCADEPPSWREVVRASGDNDGVRAYVRPQSLLLVQWHAHDASALADVRGCVDSLRFR